MVLGGRLRIRIRSMILGIISNCRRSLIYDNILGTLSSLIPHDFTAFEVAEPSWLTVYTGLLPTDLLFRLTAL